MPEEDLLLDSARTFKGEEQDGKIIGCQDRKNPGVPSSCLDSKSIFWYVLRVSYSRELKVQKRLDEKGIRSFVPMEWRKITRGSKTEMVLVPAINNLCFAKSDKLTLDEFIRDYGEDSPVHYYWDRTVGRPVVITEKVMEDFIKVASEIDKDILYLKDITPKLREGQTVVVTEGPFEGVTGKIVRIKKNRRLLVELPGFLAVTTNYINPQSLKLRIESEQ